MNTTYVIQVRYPSVAPEWVNFRRWHDRANSDPYTDPLEAIKDVTRFMLHADSSVEYRLIQRVEKEIHLVDRA